MSKLAAPQLRGTSLSWKGVVGDLVTMYYIGRNRKKYAIWIMYDIASSYFLAEASAMESMWQRIWTGTGLKWLGGGVLLVI